MNNKTIKKTQTNKKKTESDRVCCDNEAGQRDAKQRDKT
jgi:hypothetical protein